MTKKKEPDQKSLPQITTKAAFIAALLPFVCQEDTRYYLQGINVKPHKEGGIILAATDGHTLGCIWDKNGTANGEYIIRADKETTLCRELEYHFRREDTREIISEDDEIIQIQHEDVEDVIIEGGRADFFAKIGDKRHYLFSAAAEDLDGTYPQYGAVFFKRPKHSAEAFSVNPELLEKFSVAARRLRGQVTGHVKLTFLQSDGEKPGVYDPKAIPPALVSLDHPDFYGAIMPVRTLGMKYPENPFPDFLREPEKKDAA